MTSSLNVAIAGFGTIGSGVAHVLEQHLSQKEPSLKLVGILERDPQASFAKPWFDKSPELFYENLEQMLDDPKVDVIVETIGGSGFACDLITKALEKGKHVVSANKDLIAVHGKELTDLARKNDRHLLFEAAVGGAIPVLRLLKDYFQVHDINGILGILNGTTNYILCEMENNNLSFATALSQAQDLGFAEQDPTNDIKGIDARYKLVILTYLITGKWFAPDSIPLEGIDHFHIADFEYAERMGLRIKLIASLHINGNKLQAYVLPMMLEKEEMLAKISGSTNAVTIYGQHAEDISLIGKGAGSLPTASAVVADLNKIKKHPQPYLPPAESEQLELIPLDKMKFRHTLRFEVSDQPNILGHIGQIMGDLGINIYALEQLPQYHKIGEKGEEIVIFTLTLEECEEGQINQALTIINKAEYMLKPATLLRELIF